MHLRVLTMGKCVFTCYNEERVWEGVYLSVLHMGRHDFMCHDKKRVGVRSCMEYDIIYFQDGAMVEVGM